MQIEISEYQNVQRDGSWSQGLYEWKPERDVSWGRLKAGIFQREFELVSPATSLEEVVNFYVAHIRANASAFGPGKYNIRVLDNFDTRHSVTVKLT